MSSRHDSEGDELLLLVISLNKLSGDYAEITVQSDRTSKQNSIFSNA